MDMNVKSKSQTALEGGIGNYLLYLGVDDPGCKKTFTVKRKIIIDQLDFTKRKTCSLQTAPGKKK